MKHKILVVDDELSMREFLQILLEKEGHQVDLASGGSQAIELIQANSYHLVISDVRMPKVDGIEVLKFVKQNSPSTAVVMITAFASMEQAIEAIKLGAFHYITKPFKVDEIRHVIRTSIERRELEEENINLKRALGQRYSFDNLIGGSPQMLAIYDMIKRIAPTKTNVLIMGESGTGKELAAKAIHFNSPRKDGAFVTINCGAIPENLIESELFGHKKGSFTGAVSDSIGLFASADGGSLFLDEVGDLPLLTQVKLLRAIQERRFFPIGSTSAIEIDVRIISATNKDLDHEVAVNQFREDLFYRLNVISLRMPPLRDHPQDIHMLAEHFFEKHLGEQEKSIHGISQEALDVLARYNYPGNVRELENVIERAIALEQTGVILVESLPGKVVGASLAAPLIGTGFKMPPEGTDMNKILDELERDLMIQALEHSGGVKKKAAKLLNITFRSLRYRLEKHGLDSEAEDLPGQ